MEGETTNTSNRFSHHLYPPELANTREPSGLLCLGAFLHSIPWHMYSLKSLVGFFLPVNASLEVKAYGLSSVRCRLCIRLTDQQNLLTVVVCVCQEFCISLTNSDSYYSQPCIPLPQKKSLWRLEFVGEVSQSHRVRCMQV